MTAVGSIFKKTEYDYSTHERGNSGVSAIFACMEYITIIATAFGTVIASVGGWELIKYFLNRKSNKRMAEAQADDSEFSVLSKTNTFLQEQLAKKEERFAEQTDRIRTLTSENIQLTGRVARLEAERSMKLCEVRNCPNRKPQSGY